MTEVTAPPSPEEHILVQFVEALSSAADRAEVVASFCQRYPELAAKLREQAALIESLDQAGGAVPSRLGDFRIVRELKKEGMGLILEAEQEPLGRRVAVKIIRPDRLSPELQARFRREQQVLASLHQTHIVPIHAAGQQGDLQYFAMPYLEGATLRDVIEALKSRPPVEIEKNTPTLAELAQQVRARPAPPATPPVEQATAQTRQQQSTFPGLSAAAAPPAVSGQSPRLLSPRYWQSVARLMAEAAEALQHAHDLGILHRDIKPSNLMVDHAGSCWIIDFGLAAQIGANRNGSSAEAPPAAGPVAEPVVSLLATPGTPAYMAPEQWKGETLDGRTDVWGLGVTLYELLTLQRAFAGGADELKNRVVHEEAAAPRTRVNNVPHDLAAICRKAMHKNPGRRYPRAGDFAADLNRWLRGEPLEGAGVVRRVGLWARRNKGWAAALAIGLLASLALSIGFGAYQERAQEGHRQSLMRQMQLARQTKHTQRPDSWSAQSWELARKAAAIRTDDNLRDQAAAGLVGLDASIFQEFQEFDASAVLFDAAGKRLLLGGAWAWPGLGELKPRPAQPARVWDLTSGQFLKSEQIGPGPVSFGADGTPLQLVLDPKDRLTLRLWDIERQEKLREFKIPEEDEAVPFSAANVPMVALTPDGSLLAVSALLRNGKTALVLWDARTGRTLRHIRNIEMRISALTVNRESGLLAAANEQGQITLWPIQGGPAFEPLANGRTPVNCLAIRRSAERHGTAAKEKAGWLLAAGDDGGRVTIWDLERRLPKTFCFGSIHSVYAVSFSPDGATLASAGRGPAKFWDIATGRLILSLGLRDWCTGLAFSPDGKKLAASHKTAFGNDGGVVVCNLEYGRGVQTLRGLADPVAKVILSPGSKYLAALSHGWQVAVWELRTGFLVHVLNVPLGFASDNAALAFSPDGQRFAFAAGKEASLWDLASGEVKSWPLPPGLQDALAFDASGKRLMLCRLETEGGIEPPFGGTDFRKHPRVCRVRDLLAPDLTKRKWPSIEVNSRVHSMAAAPDASYFLMVTGADGRPPHAQMFEGFSAKEIRSVPGGDVARPDPTGKIVPLVVGDGKWALMEMPSWKLIETWDGTRLEILSPGARYWGGTADSGYGFLLGRRAEKVPLVTLAVDFRASSVLHQFSNDGRLLAWGSADGTVHVCDIQQVKHKLAEVGLGWE